MMSQRKFTLIELLVVVSIIAILAAILLPVLAKARFKAKLVLDASNQRQIYLGMLMFADDNEKNLPVPWGGGANPWEAYVAKRIDEWHNTGLLYQQGYVSDYSIFYCPLAQIPGTREIDYVEDGEWSSNSDNGYVGNYIRTSYLVNPYWYKKPGQCTSYNPAYASQLETHRSMYDLYGSRADTIAMYETVETPQYAVIIIDRFNNPYQICHGPYFTTTMVDGSTRILKSNAAYAALLSQDKESSLGAFIGNVQLLIP